MAEVDFAHTASQTDMFEESATVGDAKKSRTKEVLYHDSKPKSPKRDETMESSHSQLLAETEKIQIKSDPSRERKGQNSFSTVAPSTGDITDSGLGVSEFEDNRDIDDDILDLIKSCQEPIGYSSTVPDKHVLSPCFLRLETKPQNDNSNNQATKVSRRQQRSRFKSNHTNNCNSGDSNKLPHLHPGEFHSRGSTVYGATTSPYHTLEWAALQYPQQTRSNVSSASHLTSETSKERRCLTVDGSFASQVKAMKDSLRNFERQGSIMSLVNAVSMVQSLEHFNWKSLIRLVERNPTVGRELMGIYAHSLKKKPIIGNILAPEYQKLSKSAQHCDDRLRVEGSHVDQNTRLSRERNQLHTSQLQSRQYGSRKSHRTPGEMALLEGKESNRPRTKARKAASPMRKDACAGKAKKGQITLYLPTMGHFSPAPPRSPSGYLPDIVKKPRTSSTVKGGQHVGHLYKTSEEYGAKPPTKPGYKLDLCGTPLPKVNDEYPANMTRMPLLQSAKLHAPHSSMASLDSRNIQSTLGCASMESTMVPSGPAPSPTPEQDMIHIAINNVQVENSTLDSGRSRTNTQEEPFPNTLTSSEYVLSGEGQGCDTGEDNESDWSSVSHGDLDE